MGKGKRWLCAEYLYLHDRFYCLLCFSELFSQFFHYTKSKKLFDFSGIFNSLILLPAYSQNYAAIIDLSL